MCSGSKWVSSPEKAIISLNRQLNPGPIWALWQSQAALGKVRKHGGIWETLKGDKVPHRASRTDIVGLPSRAQCPCEPGRCSAGLGWQLSSSGLQCCSGPAGAVGWPQPGKPPSTGVAVVLLRPELSARALKKGGEPWSRLAPTFGVTCLCHVGFRQPSCGRALEQAAPGGLSQRHSTPAEVDPAVFDFNVMLTTVFLLG